MNASPPLKPLTHLEAGSPILGVFGYLDAILSSEQKEEAARYDVSVIRDHQINDPWPFQSLRRQVRETILNAFRFQYWKCPLNHLLAEFRLYHREDMADALTAAYFLHKRGENPVHALAADFSLRSFGLLTWEDINHFRAIDRPEYDSRTGERIDRFGDQAEYDAINAEWGHFRPFYKEGDRLIRYRLPASAGLLLVRGDRLVWEYETCHMVILNASPRWSADHAQFNSLGGNPAFLAGEFTWPPADWVNPVTNEEEAAGLGKTLRGSNSSEGRVNNGQISCSIDGVWNS